MRIECADCYTGRVAIEYVPGIRPVFVGIGSDIQHATRKRNTFRPFWEIRIVMEIFHDPGMRSTANQRIPVRIWDPFRMLLRVFDTEHDPWESVVVAFPDPEHVFRVIIIA